MAAAMVRARRWRGSEVARTTTKTIAPWCLARVSAAIPDQAH